MGSQNSDNCTRIITPTLYNNLTGNNYSTVTALNVINLCQLKCPYYLIDGVMHSSFLETDGSCSATCDSGSYTIENDELRC